MIIGIDIGGTKISAALVENGQILEQRRVASPIHDDLSLLLPRIEQLLEGWTHKAQGIGVGSAGLVGEKELHFFTAGADNILPLKMQLSNALSLPVLILNDAWAAAWGEYRLGRHDTTGSLVYVTVSTGIGGGIIQNGQLLTSTHGFSAHVGHLSVPRRDDGNILCTCGRWNCAEAVASGTAIGRRASVILSQKLGCSEVFARLDSHPELSILIDDCAEAVVQMFANIKALTGTQLIVLGGSVGLNEQFRVRVESALAKLPALYQVRLARPKLGNEADMIGAALAMQERLSEASNAGV